MIYVRVEMWPLGYKERAYVLGEAFIRNDGTGDKSVGNYTYRLNGKNGVHMNSGAVKGFPRQRYHVWNLIKIILNKAR
jgi:hypothetical protein